LSKTLRAKPNLGVVGVPTNSSGKADGVAKAPTAIRHAGLVHALGRYCKVHSEGDVSFASSTKDRDPYSGIISYDAFTSMIHAVHKGVSNSINHERFPLVIGGDCPILLGCLAALKEIYESRVGLFFIDGHEDSYPPHKSPIGEAADMELGFVLGINCEYLPSNIVNGLQVPLVDARNVCMLGPRDKKYLQKHGIKSVSGKVVKAFYDDIDIRKSKDIEGLINRVIKHLTSKRAVDKLWFHVDLDVLSTRSMRAVDYKQPGGINWNQLKKITKAIISSGYTAGMNITIYNPDMDPDGRIAKHIVSYLEYTASFL
jgi:arginase